MDENQATQGAQSAPKKKKSGKHLSLAAQLTALEQRKKDLQKRMREVKSQINVRDRKARAHRLIAAGAVLESVAGVAIEKNDLAKVETFLQAHRSELCAALE